MGFYVEILNPKGKKMLQEMADQKLIWLIETPKENFSQTISRLRKQASHKPPSLADITKEVETVRVKRYGKKKGQDNH